jgi:hypothetical protein
LGEAWGSPHNVSAANSATEQAMLGGGVRKGRADQYNTVARRLPRVNVCRGLLPGAREGLDEVQKPTVQI